MDGEPGVETAQADGVSATTADAMAPDVVAPDAIAPEAVAPETRAQDARADVPISETTERFLRALLARVPLERVEELYLFAPLRQGVVETGIAVVAARAIEPVLPAPPADAGDVIAAVEAPAVDVDATSTDEPVAETMPAEDDSPYAEDVVGAESDVDATATDATATDATIALPQADGAVIVDELAPVAAPVAAPVRHTVYTARYRLVIKGPDRGKWEIDVVDEADAPLLAIETVVRGVQRRAGEETSTVRFDAAQLRRALRIEGSHTP